MTREEALNYIKQCQDYYPLKPTLYWYQDPWADGYYNASGWYKEYPPFDAKLIDAILERDKDCEPYDLEKDSNEIKDEKLCDELAERFTSLMKRANESGNTAIDEYRKNNSHLYSMVTENHYDKITVIPTQLSTLCDFKEKCGKAACEIGLKNFYIYEHKDSQDTNGKMVYGCAPYSGLSITDAAKTAFSDALRYCDYFKKCAKESSNGEAIKILCDNIKEYTECLCKMIEVDYTQRINNYITKEQSNAD